MSADVYFEGKKVLVTGGSSGIGLATAELLARKGAHVAVIARDPVKLEASREAISAKRKAPSQAVLAAQADISDPDQVLSAVQKLAEQDFEADVLINNAGSIEVGAFVDLSLEELRRMMDVDYMGAVYVTKAVLPAMLARGSGHIVNVSSMAGFAGIYGYAAYTPPKFALIGLSEVLRCELKPEGIKVSVVCPPDADTPFLEYEVSRRPPETQANCGNVKVAPASTVAKALVEGVARGKYMIHLGTENAFYYRLKGLAPWLFFAVFDSQVRGVRKKAASGEPAEENAG